MIQGVGTDLCRIERIARAMENPRFAARIYTPAERARMENLGPERRAERAAGLFAAKEAVAKALGTGFSGFGFADVEILADGNGRPVVSLHGGAAALAPEAAIHLSITHDAGLAMAFAVIEIKEGGQ
jgi:holo-[acyl-carrier protein] synthase